MGDARGSSEQTRAEILKAARELFATRGIDRVTVRDIAGRAGFTHALVHRYFGTKEEIVAQILRREIEASTSAFLAGGPVALEPLEFVRGILLHGLTEARTTLLLITRAELAGLEPEKMLDKGQFRPIGIVTDWLRQHQAEAGGRREGVSDPALTSAVIGGAIFALQALGPWLMAAVGLQPGDTEARRDEILDILMGLVTRAAPSPEEPSSTQ